MDDEATPAHRRRRRSTRPAGAPPVTQPVDAAPAEPAAKKPRTKPRTKAARTTAPEASKPEPVRQPRSGGQRGRDNERGWRELAGNAPSQVSLSAALRARDLGRPRPDQLAAAERDLPIVRRQWQPEA